MRPNGTANIGEKIFVQPYGRKKLKKIGEPLHTGHSTSAILKRYLGSIVAMSAPLRQLGRFAVYAFTVIVLLFAAVAAYIYTHEAEIKKQLVEQLNQRLNSPVKVNGPIYISWFEDFPSITLSFPALEIAAVEQEKVAQYPLVRAGRLSLSFSLADLYRGQYQLTQLTITDAQIDLRFDEAGNPNYYIWKSTGESTGNTQFAIQKLVLRRVQLHYSNASENQLLSAQLTDADFKGNFSERKFQLQAKAALEGGSLQLDGKQFLKNQPLQVNLAMEVDLDAKTIRFPDSELRLNREKIRLTGYHRWAEPLETDLHFQAEKFRAAQLLALYGGGNAFLDELDIDGELQLDGHWQYKSGNPLLDIKAVLQSASLRYPLYDLQFKGSSTLQASYDRSRGLDLQCKTLQLQHQKNQLTGQLRFQQQPNLLSGSLKGDLRLEAFEKLLERFGLQSARGRTTFQQQFRMYPGTNKPVTFGGNLRLFDVDVQYAGHALRQLRLSANIHDQGKTNIDLQLEHAQIDSMALKGQLKIENYPALYQPNIGRVKLTGALEADRWRWDTQSENGTTEEAVLPDAMFDLQLKVRDFYWYAYHFEQVSAKLKGEVNNLHIDLQQTRLAQGQLRGRLHWMQIPQGYKLQGSLQGKKMAINKLFQTFHDFDQDFITQKHLSGELDASATLLLYFDRNYNLLPQQMEVLADLDLKQGALTQFEPLNALSRFVDAEELKNLRFQRLYNHIEIKGGKIDIPQMDVNSNAAQLAVAGEHLLDNSYHYYVEISLSDLWQKKTKKINFDPNLAEQKAGGGVKLFLEIVGKGGDFDIRYNKLQVRQAIREQAGAVRKDIGKLVREELDGTAKNRTYENDRLNDIVPIEAEADTLEIPKEKDFNPVYLRKPKSRRGG